jgi:hypothetical protein
MSTNGISFASPPLSPGSPTNTSAYTGSRDTEMTCLLTSIEDENPRSRSSSPKRSRMSYQPCRDRGERQGSARPSNDTSGRSSVAPGTMTYSQETPSMTSTYHNAPGQYGAPYGGQYGGQYAAQTGYQHGSQFGSQYGGHFQEPYDPRAPEMASYGPSQPRPRSNSEMTGGGSVPLSSVVPGNTYPTREQLEVAYAYGIQREDGSYTRLIRADEVNDIQNVPRGQGPEGLIILPSPRQADPSLRVGPEPMIPSSVSPIVFHFE